MAAVLSPPHHPLALPFPFPWQVLATALASRYSGWASRFLHFTFSMVHFLVMEFFIGFTVFLWNSVVLVYFHLRMIFFFFYFYLIFLFL